MSLEFVVGPDILIDDVQFSTRIKNVCRAGGFVTLADLAAMTRAEISVFPNIGPKSVSEIEEVLASFGLELNPREDEKTEEENARFHAALDKICEARRADVRVPLL